MRQDRDKSIDAEIREIRAGWDALKSTMGTGFDAAEDVAKRGDDPIIAAMTARHNSLMAAIDLHRRLARLEALHLPTIHIKSRDSLSMT